MKWQSFAGRWMAAGLGVCVLTGAVQAADEAQPYLGRWALTIPGGGAGWLGVTKEKGWYDASILWGGGSVVPVSSVFFTDGMLNVTRTHEVKRKNAKGKVIRVQQFTDLITATVLGDTLELKLYSPHRNGVGMDVATFSGKRIPPLPPAPDLGHVKFGKPIVLFNGRNLDGWRPTNPRALNGWTVEDGILRNKAVQEKGKPHRHYTNLRTDREFEDFNLSLEVRVPKGGNSGVYLRGIYEVQVTDSYGQPLDSHHMGAIYSRLTPTVNAEKPAGEWQIMDITLVDRHVTVILNGRKIIDNQPLLGCTGGALWSDEFRPGPIYLQGDHTSVDYRNLILRPVVK
jgi:hypothetical protein